MGKQSISTTSKLALLAFLMLTIAAPTLSTTQPTTERNAEVMKAIILQGLGKEQLAAKYLKKMAVKEQLLGLEEEKLAMVVEQKPINKCEGKGGPCTWAECCLGLICAYVFPIGKFGTCVDL